MGYEVKGLQVDGCLSLLCEVHSLLWKKIWMDSILLKIILIIYCIYLLQKKRSKDKIVNKSHIL